MGFTIINLWGAHFTSILSVFSVMVGCTVIVIAIVIFPLSKTDFQWSPGLTYNNNTNTTNKFTKQAYIQNTQQDKITIKKLNNNFEKKIKW